VPALATAALAWRHDLRFERAAAQHAQVPPRTHRARAVRSPFGAFDTIPFCTAARRFSRTSPADRSPLLSARRRRTCASIVRPHPSRPVLQRNPPPSPMREADVRVHVSLSAGQRGGFRRTVAVAHEVAVSTGGSPLALVPSSGVVMPPTRAASGSAVPVGAVERLRCNDRLRGGNERIDDA
jgi:hypothetical protein